jgi:putative transposase
VKYAFVDRQRAHWPVVTLCGVVGVSVSGYYASKLRPVREDESGTVSRIWAIHRRSGGAYGWPRVWRSLRAQGVEISKERTRLLMQQHSIRGLGRRRYGVKTKSVQQEVVVANVLNRQFNPLRENEVWTGDITYIRTAEGWLFLALILDLYSRKIVGYALADHLRTTLPLEALRRAQLARRPKPGLLFHSDRGCQYVSQEYRYALAQMGAQPSVSRAGECWDNAPSESCFGSLKVERVHQAKYASIEAAKIDLIDWICWYNTERLHSTLGYLSPATFEQQNINKQNQMAA